MMNKYEYCLFWNVFVLVVIFLLVGISGETMALWLIVAFQCPKCQCKKESEINE